MAPLPPSRELGADGDTLTGWREIAAYLGRSVRTAQRWESELGLPVRRGVGPDGLPSAEARRGAIDEWRAQQTSLDARSDDEGEDLGEVAPGATMSTAPPSSAPSLSGPSLSPLSLSSPSVSPTSPLPPSLSSPRTWTPRRRWAAILAALASGLAVGAALAPTVAPVARVANVFQVAGFEVRGLTESDATVWTYPLNGPARHPETILYSQPREGDVDGDGVSEVAVGVTFAHPETLPTQSDAALLFGRDGQLRWRIQPTLSLPGDGGGFAGPWRIRDIAFSSTPPARVWLAYASEQPLRDAFVLEVTPDGDASIRFIHRGSVTTLIEWATPAGSYLAVGGTDAETSLATVAVLSRAKAPARWPVEPDAAPCAGCPRGVPEAVVLFPTSELHDILPGPSLVYRLWTIDGRLRVDTDDGPPRPTLLAWVEPDLRLREVYHPLRYWTVHEGLRAEGRIDHDADTCPDRRLPSSVRVWRPASGWTEDAVAPPGNELPTVSGRSSVRTSR